jgi:cytosine deaminase
VSDHDDRYRVALEQAMLGLDEGGIPIGGALFIGDELVGAGRNRRVQEDSPIIHGEIDVFRSAGRPRFDRSKRLTLYTTLSPCYMCAGASMIYGVHTVVIGENKNFEESEKLLTSRGVELIVLDDPETLAMFTEWTRTHQELWFEDIPDPRR